LLDKIVSKEHCIVEQRGNMFVLRDLGSLNGTYVNRERVHGEWDLKHGDEIALGQTKARFEDTPPSHYPPPPSTTAAPAGSQQAQGWPPGSQQGQKAPPAPYPAYGGQPP